MTRLYTGTANQVYPRLVGDIVKLGRKIEVRGTNTLEVDPVVIDLERPWEPLVTSYGRPINVTFAIAEVLWMLLGRRDVAMLQFYNEQIKQFSDDGLVFNAPYGYRLRHAHGYDQIKDAELTLRQDPGTRRAVMVIWHPNDKGWSVDPELRTIVERRSTKDRACNVMAEAWIRDGKLNWFQVIRSNDALLGIPYNFFQWTHVQQYMAKRLEVGQGEFTYCSVIPHLYTDTYYKEIPKLETFDLYRYSLLNQGFIGAVDDNAMHEVEKCEEAARLNGYQYMPTMGDAWDTALWMFAAHHEYKQGRNESALDLLKCVPGTYAVAQSRFYWEKRWKKLTNADYFLEHILGGMPPTDTAGMAIYDWFMNAP